MPSWHILYDYEYWKRDYPIYNLTRLRLKAKVLTPNMFDDRMQISL